MKLPRFVRIALLVLLAGGIGYLVGIFKPVYDFKTGLRTRGAAAFHNRIGMLSMLREGGEEGKQEVIRRLEISFSNSVLMAASTPSGNYLGVDPSRLSKIQVDALRLAKRYCDWYPEVPLQSQSRDLLRQVTFERLEILDKPSPEWETTDFDGKKHALRDYRGKVVVLDFWNTGCAPCLRAMPQVKQLVEDFKDQAVAVLGMYTDGEEEEEDGRSIVKKMELNYPNLRADGLPEKYGLRSSPTLLVIDRHGIVRAAHVAHSPRLREEVTESVEKLLAD